MIAASGIKAGSARCGDCRAAATDRAMTARWRRSVAPNPSRRMGASIHRQEAAASVIVTAVSAARMPGVLDWDPARAEKRDHGPVPEVDAVRADTDPAQRRPAEHPAQCPGTGRGHHHPAGRQRGERDPALVDGTAAPGDVRQLPGEDREADQADQVQPACLGLGCGGDPLQRPAQGQARAHEQGDGVSVGAVVQARGTLADRVPDGHGHRGRGRAQPDHHRARPPARAGTQDNGQEERPEQVELLLDGQGPEVLQRRRRAEHREVGLVVQGLPPVARVSDRREQPRPQGRQLIRLEHGDRCRDRHEHDRQAGQEPPGSADPESAQIDSAAPIPRRGEQVGDQVSADDEEDIHAQEASGQPGYSLVEGQDHEHRDSPQAVQATSPRARPGGAGLTGGRPGAAGTAGCQPFAG